MSKSSFPGYPSYSFFPGYSNGSAEDISNKVTSLTDDSTDAQYPSAKCVYDELQDLRSDMNMQTMFIQIVGGDDVYADGQEYNVVADDYIYKISDALNWGHPVVLKVFVNGLGEETLGFGAQILSSWSEGTSYAGILCHGDTLYKLILKQNGGTNGKITITRINELTQIIPTTYLELKQLRDSGGLIAGQQYRITDYECTTTQTDTRSAGHRFDIIVTALDDHTLSEEAKAIQNEEITALYSPSIDDTFYRDRTNDGEFEGKYYYAFVGKDSKEYLYTDIIVGKITYKNCFVFYGSEDNNKGKIADAHVIDTYAHVEGTGLRDASYFANSNLNAWKIWYCLDNDKVRFYWANDKSPSPISIDDIDYIQIEYDDLDIHLQDQIENMDPDDTWGFYKNGGAQNQTVFGFSSDSGASISQDDIIVLYGDSITNTDVVYRTWDNKQINTKITSIDGADVENLLSFGKGVIYRMIDEFNNDVAYDFKNIQFKRYKITASTKAPYLENLYYGIRNNDNYTITDTDFIWCYTFNYLTNNSSKLTYDASVKGNDGTLLNDESQINGVYNNIIPSYYTYNDYPDDPHTPTRWLNNIVFASDFDFDNNAYYGCYNNVFEANCYGNTFGNMCHDNTIATDCNMNIFRNDCFNNILKTECKSNIFDNQFYQNVLGSGCNNNIFGYQLQNNTIGINVRRVLVAVQYVRYMQIGDDVFNIDIQCEDTEENVNNYLRHIKISSGVSGPINISNPLSIVIPDRNLNYQTTVAMNSSGQLKIYCEADLVQ